MKNVFLKLGKAGFYWWYDASVLSKEKSVSSLEELAEACIAKLYEKK